MGIKNANGNRLANYSSPTSNGSHCKYRGCFWNGKRKAEFFRLCFQHLFGFCFVHSSNGRYYVPIKNILQLPYTIPCFKIKHNIWF